MSIGDAEIKTQERVIRFFKEPGFLFEFKHTNDDHVDLDALADRALQQIDVKKYDTELRDAGVRPIIKIGIAFRGKTAVVKRK